MQPFNEYAREDGAGNAASSSSLCVQLCLSAPVTPSARRPRSAFLELMLNLILSEIQFSFLVLKFTRTFESKLFMLLFTEFSFLLM